MKNDPTVSQEERQTIAAKRRADKLRDAIGRASARAGFSGKPANREERRRLQKNLTRAGYGSLFTSPSTEPPV
jgi:SOS response regulatory protein OraA/RecX